MKQQDEPIEAVMWRTMKILRVFDAWDLRFAIMQTHPITLTRLTRYINHLRRAGCLFEHGNKQYQISPTAPAQAPIFRKQAQ